MAKVTMYTDGGASGNPGPGGYGTLLMYGQHVKEMSEGFRLTTNNRMELLAVIVGLEALTRDGVEVEVYSDSKYVVDAVTKRWVFGWEKKGYKDKKNPDLWERFLRIYRKHKVTFHWVKGHAGNPLNERVDAMAVAAYQTGNLLTDTW
ncbi:MAG: ribonuclease HI, partial [Bacteroidetes bacterium]|nr:ribonuclease HI [Bacteroidota bacterium]MDA0904485.1 ribonuclease HI [Bacteroidota bacterium]